MFNSSVILLKEDWSGFHCVRTGALRRDFLSSLLSFRRKNPNLHSPPRSFIYSFLQDLTSIPQSSQILHPLCSGLCQGHILVAMVKCLLVLCLSWPSLSWKSGLHLCGSSPMLSSCQHSWLRYFFMSASRSQTMTWRLINYESLAFRFVSLTLIT